MQAMAAGVRIVVPAEYQLTPPVSLPPLDAEPPISDADDARFDVRREKEVLIDEGWSTSNGGGDGAGGDGGLACPGAGGMRGDASGDGAAAGLGAAVSNGGGRDPASLEATVRRLVDAPEEPVVDKYVRMGYKRDAVIFGLAMMGDKETRVVDFVMGFEQMRGMGFSGDTIAGALACNDNDIEAAIGSCLR